MTDLGDWIVEAGDRVIRKRAARDSSGVAAAEHAVYCLWVIDYAVRNSGTLEPIAELYPAAITELSAFAASHGLSVLSQWLGGTGNQSEFCATYWDHFDAACGELRACAEVA